MKPVSLQIHTTRHTQFVDITGEVNSVLTGMGIREGICFLYVPHTTAGITINENADPTVQEDITKYLDRIIPWENNYKHAEGNSAAHIKSSLLGNSCQVIISEGKLVLGTWQGIFFCEFDGPRNRKVYLKVITD